MIKSKAELDGMEPPPDACRDPVLKRNRAKRLQLFTRMLVIGVLQHRLKGIAKHSLEIFFVNKKEKKKKKKKKKRLILDARVVNWAFVSPPSVNLCSSEAMSRIEVSLPEHVEEGSPDWHSDLDSIELFLGLGDIQGIHHYVLDDEFASYFGSGHFAGSLSLAPTWKGACWKTIPRWMSYGLPYPWGSRGAITSFR